MRTFKLLILPIFLLLSFTAGLIVGKGFNKETPSTSLSSTSDSRSFQPCDPLALDNYKLATVDGIPAEFGVDLKGEGNKQLIRIYSEDSSIKSLPIVLKVFSYDVKCLKEEFSYDGRDDNRVGNELEAVAVKNNFWGDGRDVLFFSVISTGYGSGYTEYINFLTCENGNYSIVKGPIGSELSRYKFSGTDGEGKEMLVARGVWGEDESHFSPHRYVLEKWVWNGYGYDKVNLGTTRNKYELSKNKSATLVDEIIKSEPELFSLTAP